MSTQGGDAGDAGEGGGGAGEVGGGDAVAAAAAGTELPCGAGDAGAVLPADGRVEKWAGCRDSQRCCRRRRVGAAIRWCCVANVWCSMSRARGGVVKRGAAAVATARRRHEEAGRMGRVQLRCVTPCVVVVFRRRRRTTVQQFLMMESESGSWNFLYRYM